MALAHAQKATFRNPPVISSPFRLFLLNRRVNFKKSEDFDY
jgi:hypothetical protein